MNCATSFINVAVGGHDCFTDILSREQYSVNMDPFNPLPDNKILDWSKLKQSADDILKCILNEK